MKPSGKESFVLVVLHNLLAHLRTEAQLNVGQDNRTRPSAALRCVQWGFTVDGKGKWAVVLNSF